MKIRKRTKAGSARNGWTDLIKLQGSADSVRLLYLWPNPDTGEEVLFEVRKVRGAEVVSARVMVQTFRDEIARHLEQFGAGRNKGWFT